MEVSKRVLELEPIGVPSGTKLVYSFERDGVYTVAVAWGAYQFTGLGGTENVAYTDAIYELKDYINENNLS